MKKRFLSVALFLFIASATAFAHQNDISDKLKKAFEREFAGATSVQWTSFDDYEIASFVLDGYAVQAYFSTNGELMGFSRSIQLDQLPLKLNLSFRKRYPGANFKNVLEVYNVEGVCYWITVEWKNKVYRVKANETGTTLDVINK
jgi:hypothetical protein